MYHASCRIASARRIVVFARCRATDLRLVVARPLTALATIWLLGCGASPEAARLARGAAPMDTVDVIEHTAVGLIKFGQLLEDVNRTLGDSLKATFADFERCDAVWPARFHGGASLMVLRDSVGAHPRVERLDTEEKFLRTREGIGVGDTEERVRMVYGARISVQPNTNSPFERAKMLLLREPGDSIHLIVFDTDGERVIAVRAGRVPAVTFGEGCA